MEERRAAYLRRLGLRLAAEMGRGMEGRVGCEREEKPEKGFEREWEKEMEREPGAMAGAWGCSAATTRLLIFPGTHYIIL